MRTVCVADREDHDLNNAWCAGDLSACSAGWRHMLWSALKVNMMIAMQQLTQVVFPPDASPGSVPRMDHIWDAALRSSMCKNSSSMAASAAVTLRSATPPPAMGVMVTTCVGASLAWNPAASVRSCTTPAGSSTHSCNVQAEGIAPVRMQVHDVWGMAGTGPLDQQ
jgi:hypothetical protein